MLGLRTGVAIDIAVAVTVTVTVHHGVRVTIGVTIGVTAAVRHRAELSRDELVHDDCDDENKDEAERRRLFHWHFVCYL